MIHITGNTTELVFEKCQKSAACAASTVVSVEGMQRGPLHQDRLRRERRNSQVLLTQRTSPLLAGHRCVEDVLVR
jgi:hypothetical protein